MADKLCRKLPKGINEVRLIQALAQKVMEQEEEIINLRTACQMYKIVLDNRRQPKPLRAHDARAT